MDYINAYITLKAGNDEQFLCTKMPLALLSLVLFNINIILTMLVFNIKVSFSKKKEFIFLITFLPGTYHKLQSRSSKKYYTTACGNQYRQTNF